MFAYRISKTVARSVAAAEESGGFRASLQGSLTVADEGVGRETASASLRLLLTTRYNSV